MAIPLFENNKPLLFTAAVIFIIVSLFIIVVAFLLYQSQKKDLKSAAE